MEQMRQLFLVNATVLFISFTAIEQYLSVILLVGTIIYTVLKIINEYKRLKQMWQGISFRQNQIQGVRMNKIKERFIQFYRPITKKYDK